MKKILFATAHSKFSNNTWKYVLKIAQYFGAEVTVLHVYEVATLLAAVDGAMERNYNLKRNAPKVNQQQVELERLEQFTLDKPKQFHNVTIKRLAKTKSGSISASILEEATAGQYDLIVMGAATTKRLTQRLLGSVAQKVLNHATVPVFLVPPTSHFLGIRKIVYATNFKNDDVAIIKKIMEWIQVFGAELQLLHVYQDKVNLKAAAEKMNKLIKELDAYHSSSILVHQLIKGKVSEALRAYMKVEKINMVVLNKHKKGLLVQLFQGDTTQDIMTKSLVPTLIFRGH